MIRSHTTIGGSILSKAESLSGAAQVARYHHERYDGFGYPQGLKGAEIPTHARIVAIADAYDAMHSDRVYRKSIAPDEIRRRMVKERGKQFDPEYLDCFLELLDSGVLDALNEKAAET